MQEYFVRNRSGTRGPLRLDEIRKMIREGTFRSYDAVWSTEEDRWVEASRLKAIRSLFEGETTKPVSRRLIAIASGKGGVGKTVLSASLASALAALGHRVILVDGDWGGPDLHCQFGIAKPRGTFAQMRKHRRLTLEELSEPTPLPNLRLVTAEQGVLGAARSSMSRRLRFLRMLAACQSDFVIVDLAAGTDLMVLDLFLAADEPIVVATPDPLSLQEVINLLKTALVRRWLRMAFPAEAVRSYFNGDGKSRYLILDKTVPEVLAEMRYRHPKVAKRLEEDLQLFRPRLILNMVHDRRETKEAGALQFACRDLLGIEVGYLGHVDWDSQVREAVKHFRPFLLYDPTSPASRSLVRLVVVRLLGKSRVEGFFASRRLGRRAQEMEDEAASAEGMEAEIICSFRCPYWGDCEFQTGGEMCAVRQFEPVLRSSFGNAAK